MLTVTLLLTLLRDFSAARQLSPPDLPLVYRKAIRMYWYDLHQIFTIDTHMSGHDQSDLFAIAKGTSLWQSIFAANRRKLAYTHLHSERWRSTTNGRIARRMRALTPPTTLLRLIKIWWISPSAIRVAPGGIHDRLCHAFLVYLVQGKECYIHSGA